MNPLAPEPYVVGVDGGATKTVALFGAGTRIFGHGEAGSSNYHNIGTVEAGKAIGLAVARARRQARLSRITPMMAVVALAGVDSERGFRIAHGFVRAAKVAQQAFVIHDAVAAVYAATRGSPGIVVNSGTGSFAAGINRTGKYVRVGGWGYLIDDRGSGFDVGIKAITVGFQMMDGRTRRTKLMSLLKGEFGVRRFDEILDGIYSNQISVEEIADLTTSVAKAASRDKACRSILKDVGTALADLACSTARRLNMAHTAFPLFMVGGVFKSGYYFTEPFMKRVRSECPRVHFVRLKGEPATGAYLIACRLAHYGMNALPTNDRWLKHVVN